MMKLFSTGLLLFILVELCSGTKGSATVLDPSEMTTPPDDKIICWSSEEEDYTGYVDSNYLNEDGVPGVEGDVCDHTDPTAENQVRDSCYFYVKFGKSQWKRSCMHHSHCPAGDNMMGCVKGESSLACCCKGNKCNHYEKYAELGYSDEDIEVEECDLSEIIRPCECWATQQECEDARSRCHRTECTWDIDNNSCHLEGATPAPTTEGELQTTEDETVYTTQEDNIYTTQEEEEEYTTAEPTKNPTAEPTPMPTAKPSEPPTTLEEPETTTLDQPPFEGGRLEEPEGSQGSMIYIPCGGFMVVNACPTGTVCSEPPYNLATDPIPKIGACVPLR